MFPKAREAIKYLVKDGRFDYIEAGSLISIKENVKDIVIPSEERHLKMYPLEQGLHEKAMLLFRQYMLVGGMPKSVVAFVEGRKDFAAADHEKRDILELYRADIMKIGAKYRGKVLSVYDQIPGFLLSHEKRSYVKCYMGDTGLLLSHAFDENDILEEEVYKQILENELSLNEGMLFENMIAQMLVANGHKLYFYTHYSDEKHRNDIEIDFIISNNSKLKYKMYPIEVKSGKRYTAKSLKRFQEKYMDRIGECYIVHPRNLCFKENIICIPPYMVICL